MRQLTAILAAVTVLGASPLHAQYTTFSNRTLFESFLNNRIVDDFSDPGYAWIQSSAAMTAVKGETQFTATGFANVNVVSGGMYCAGCQGTFRLSFGSTSVSDGSGVFGVGFDVIENNATLPYLAYVQFADGSTANLGLSTGSFFGLTSELGISSIHVGLLNGGSSTGGKFIMDNLTIGDSNAPPPPPMMRLAFFEEEEPFTPFFVQEPGTPPVTTAPEPSSVALLAAGLAGVAMAARRRRRVAAE